MSLSSTYIINTTHIIRLEIEVITIMGNTTAAEEALMTQSSTKQVSCTRVKTWTFHSGT